MKNLLVVGLLAGCMAGLAGDKRPTVQSLAAQVEDNNKVIMDAAKDIMKMSQDLDAMKTTIAAHDKTLSDVADLSDELNDVMPKIIHKINDLSDRVNALEQANRKVGAGPEHNLDAYGREAN